VGGTQANVNSGTGARISEVGWSGSGGGWSLESIAFNNTRPSWQTGSGVPAVNAFNNHRLVPDIGFHAAGLSTGAYQFYYSNSLQTTSVGTSFASPQMVGAAVLLKQIDPSGPLPDRYVQSNYEAMNALKLGMEKSKFRGREDTMKLIEALEGLEMTEGDDFPQGDKVLRKEDHQAFIREFIFDMKGGNFHIIDVVPKEKTIFPPACTFA